MMMHVPNFADLVNKQAASYELIADSLSSLNPAFIQKMAATGKKTRKRDKIKSFLGRKGKAPGDANGAGASGEGSSDDDDDDDGQDPYGLALHSAQGGLPLPLLLKRTELAVVDLKVLVKHSTLPEEPKILLVEQLQSFHTRAKTTTSEKKLKRLYQETMEDARNHIRDLILQAQGVLQSLDTLETILLTIHEITMQETRQQSRAHDETLAQLWSRLGGNRLEREFYRENLGLLRGMEGQRKTTMGQIQAALWKLTEFEAEIGNLREKIVVATVDSTVDGGPQVVFGSDSESTGHSGGPGTISLKAHIQQIDLVTSRLKDRGFLADAMVKAQADNIQNLAEDISEASTP
ncbi:hypothetical protein BGX27_008144 [Mortierella sp. AM989]|nr:hypothetical protein BGX27_008144 [Mortierella sp. AM989]